MKPAGKAFPSAIACGLLEDKERALFLSRTDSNGRETVELPICPVFAGENPVSRLSESFRNQTGIDAQVHEIEFEKRHNAGSRKKKRFVPVLVFRMSAKSHSAKPANEFSGYRWISRAGLSRHTLARNCEWLH